MSTIVTIQSTDVVANSRADINANFAALNADKQETSAKDATGGYAGLTLFKINFKNAANTFTSFFTNANTAARTYTFPDKDGTVAMTSDIPSSTTALTEGSNLYFTNARAIASTLTGYTSGAGTITSSDTILGAIQKLNGNIAALTTSSVSEGSNLYFTNARAIASTLTGYTSGAGTISSADTVLSAIQKLNGNIAGLTTAVVSEVTNLYFTTARVLATAITGFSSGSGTVSATDTILQAINKLDGNDGLRQLTSAKDATGGYVGMTLFKINFKNAANTFTNFFTNATTAARTYTFPDKDITVAGIVDIPSSTTALTEGSNLYFTNARAIASTLTGYTSGAGTVASTDTILQAIQKLNGNDALKANIASPSFTGTVTLPTGLTGVLRADSGVVSVDTDVTDIVSAASTSAAGKVELATTAEIDTGTDSTRAMPVDQFVASARNVRFLDFYVIEKATDNAVGTNVFGAFECPFTGTITEIGAYVETAGTTNASVWDVNKNGTTIMTTNKLSIDSAEVSTRTAATAPTLTTTAITAGDLITIDCDSLSTTKPKGLHIRIGIRLS